MKKLGLPIIIGVVIVAALVLIALHALQRQEVQEGVPYRVDAAQDAQYHVDCRYPGYKVQGEFVNTTAFDQKGPTSGILPTDRPRCTIKKISGTGPVTLTLTKDGKVSTAVAADPGQESKAYVL
ncbi:MAG: hypothetical protein JSR45_10070 [Proteobacteria bacterium]|nr:hypothetical protein [Pseudomonadota bacterium]